MTRSISMLVAIVAIAIASSTASAAEAIAIVAHKDLAISNLSMGELRAIFLGKLRQNGTGKRLVPLNLKSAHPFRVSFDTKVLEMSSSDVARYWVDQRIRGDIREPKALSSPKLVATIVNKLAGAIGYLPASMVPPGLSVVKIGGHSPGHAKYPLVLP